MQAPVAIKSGRSQTDAVRRKISGMNSELIQDSELGEKLDYPTRLSLYDYPPPSEISMEEFERFALDRIYVLKTIETASIRNMSEAETFRNVKEILHKSMPFNSNMALKQGVDVDGERRKDYISHYILRLAYCRSEDLRQWFTRYEVILFKAKWDICSREERQVFLDQSRFKFSPMSAEKRSAMKSMLSDSSTRLDDEQFFEVPFESVPDLVYRREVYLLNGSAYVPQNDLISVILADYRRELTKALEVTAKALPRLDDDDRLKPVLEQVSSAHVNSAYVTKSCQSDGSAVTHNDIDKLSSHFPPCMRHLFYQLKRDHHLKHFGRMQFGLFLKGLGLSLEEALIFWRKAFTKLSDDQFQKGGYTYNIRHNYGQEGKRVNYTPYSCMKIITGNSPSSGDHHGCPFKHFGKENLRSLLHGFGLNAADINDISDTASAHHYQIACTKYFECTHGLSTSGTKSNTNPEKTIVVETITHPNQFIDLSMSLQEKPEIQE